MIAGTERTSKSGVGDSTDTTRPNRKHEHDQAATRPRALPINLDGYLDSLRAKPRWICWRYDRVNNRWSKVPYQARNPKAKAAVNDPATWGTFGEAVRACQEHGLDSVGYVLDQGEVGIDLDDVRDPSTGEIEPWAQIIIHAMDSYTELSPSSTGAKIVAQGHLPVEQYRLMGVELYDHTSPRYFTLTGNAIGDRQTVEPRQEQIATLQADLIERKRQHDQAKQLQKRKPSTSIPASSTDYSLTDQDILAKASRFKAWPKLQRLLSGDWSGYVSPSEADLALCNLLVPFTDDPDQVLRLINVSGAMRPKWEREDYAERTIGKAFAGRGWRYDPDYFKRVQLRSLQRKPLFYTGKIVFS